MGLCFSPSLLPIASPSTGITGSPGPSVTRYECEKTRQDMRREDQKPDMTSPDKTRPDVRKT